MYCVLFLILFIILPLLWHSCKASCFKNNNSLRSVESHMFLRCFLLSDFFMHTHLFMKIRYCRLWTSSTIFWNVGLFQGKISSYNASGPQRGCPASRGHCPWIHAQHGPVTHRTSIVNTEVCKRTLIIQVWIIIGKQ